MNITFSRQTGKTHRMLLRAFTELIKGFDVIVVAYTQLYVEELVRRFKKDFCNPTKTKITHDMRNEIRIENGCTIQFISCRQPDFSLDTNSRCGSDATVIYDHTVLDIAYRHLLDQWLLDSQE